MKIPVHRLQLGVAEFLHLVGDDLVHDVDQLVLHLLGVHDLVAETVDFLALLVHHVVVLEGALADLEVVLLDVLLRGLDGAVEQAAVADGFTLADAFLDEFEQAVAGGEEPQQVVL